MGRGRVKGKKLSVANQDDPGSGEEEKIPAQKRRGRPQKSLKDEIDDDKAQKIGDEYSEDTTTGMLNKEMRGSNSTQNGNKRKKDGHLKEKADSVEDENENENENGPRSSTEDMNKSNGFRPARNRRKNKPCRAAEVGVDLRLF
ncbi:uncharacterized protein LOC111393283 [Olea europaea var. sylvestris]|uniref:Uncharacterized protein n=1 Tax=Olea europaea subsp. europaea TaxID=158383 RepID=A0A8S0QE42_OLEEU|nr:uncharacterized protein LOC111393283 [Olea europaea var. sylvestris]CAA2965577.1 Hypothetical predicted protein [Olea europaea subsp. europaea]